MHETIIAKQIIEEAEKHGEVESITVEVGDLAHLPAEEMEKTLKEMVGWDVNVKRKKAVTKCDCGYRGEPKIITKGHDSSVWKCPNCRTLMPEIIDGQEIILKDVTVK